MAAPGGGRIPSLHDAPVFEREGRQAPRMALFEEARKELGDEIELLHDVHERYTPTEAVQFCKEAEKFRLFFLEDPLSPEDIDWFKQHPRPDAPRRWRWANCSTARMNGRR